MLGISIRKEIILKSVLAGLLAMLFLLGIYFVILTLVSGGNFALRQFFRFWYFILALAAGFGLQIGLYIYLKKVTGQTNKGTGKVVAVSGTTSSLSMIACCSHYLVNILPMMGIVGLVTLVSQYQIELFWLGLLANLGGISYLVSRVKEIP